MVGEDGFEPSKRNVTDLQSAPFGHSGTPPYLELHVGVEPTTCWLQVSCSAIEPMKRIYGGNNRDRTCDPLLVRQMLSQLSYASIFFMFFKMVGEDGFEPSKRNVTDLQSAPFGHSGTPPFKLYIINNLSSFNFALPNWQRLVYSHYLLFSTPKFYCLSILFFIFYVFLLFTLI